MMSKNEIGEIKATFAIIYYNNILDWIGSLFIIDQIIQKPSVLYKTGKW